MKEKQELQQQLEQLERLIASLQVGDQSRQQLLDLVDQIQLQIDESEDSPTADLRDQLEAMVAGFEAEHPTLAGVLKNIMISLANMGV